MARVRSWTEGSATALAVMRLTVAIVMLALPEAHEARGLARALAGRSLVGPLTVDPVVCDLAYALYVGSAVAGAIGLVPRVAFGVLTASALYLLAIPQLAGATVHYHHLVWFAALLTVAPSADALSPSNPRFRGPRSLAHGVPVRTAQVLLGCVYTFPGLHKLATQGLCWDPTSLLAWKLAQSPEFVPWFTPGPALLRGGGLAVVAFELLFLPAVLVPALRPFAALGGALFHGVAAAVFDIPFVSLWACYPILLPWDRTAAAPGPTRSARGPWVVGALVLSAVFATGISGRTEGWPFACYPTFATPPPDHLPALLVEWTDAAGVDHEVPMDRWPLVTPRGGSGAGQRRWREVWSMSGVGGPVDRPGLERLWDRIVAQEPIEDAVEVRFYGATMDVEPGPERWSRGRLLHRRILDPDPALP